jgi:hypothetical protein
LSRGVQAELLGGVELDRIRPPAERLGVAEMNEPVASRRADRVPRGHRAATEPIRRSIATAAPRGEQRPPAMASAVSAKSSGEDASPRPRRQPIARRLRGLVAGARNLADRSKTTVAPAARATSPVPSVELLSQTMSSCASRVERCGGALELAASPAGRELR